MLDLAEELMLLALDAETGRIHDAARTAIAFGLSGAVLMDLALTGKISIDDGKVQAINSAATGDPVLDTALRQIENSPRPRKVEDWVKRLAMDRWGRSFLEDEILERLVSQGILRREEHRILRLIPTTRYPEQNRAPERDLMERLRAVLIDGDLPDTRLAALIGLLQACGLVGVLFTKNKQAKDRAAAIARGERTGKDVTAAVEKATEEVVTAAITAAVVAATISASTSAATTTSVTS
ncbi:MAG TPA: GPP34 family phosphoprotein [Chloroflexota bacterium]|nr:GPP34 family phosphoprotein [Chloroflexota bacterium]